MTWLRRLWTALRTANAVRSTITIWLVVWSLLCAGVWATVEWDAKRIAAAKEAGRSEVRAAAQLQILTYQASIAHLLQRKDSIVRVVDTITIRVKASAAAATKAIAAVPPVERADSPAVDAALERCAQLAASSQALVATHQTERFAWRDLHAADSAMVVALSVSMVEKDSTIAQVTRERDARPRWRTVAKVGGTAVAIGIAIGNIVIPRVIP